MPKKAKQPKTEPEIKMFLRATIVLEQTERNKAIISGLMRRSSVECALADGDPLLKLTSEVVQGVCRPKVSMDILPEMPAVELKSKTEAPRKSK